MPADRGDRFMLDETERLPWLEPAEPIEEFGTVPLRKLIMLVLLFLVLFALVIGAGWWYMSRGEAAADGNVTVIEPLGGPEKIPANQATGEAYNAEGKHFAGTDDEAYAASAGRNSAGEIDASKAPEMPVTDLVGPSTRPPAPSPAPAARPAAQAPRGVASARIRDDTRPVPPARPAPPPVVAAPAEAPGGPQVQLGAYNSEAIAETAWRRLVERFAELAGAGHRVVPVVANGRTLYRLRMDVADGAAGRAICGKLRVAGESCWAVQ